MMVDIVKRRVPERWDLDPVRDIQVIAPMYRGAAGVNNLNSRLQSELNGDFRVAEVKLGARLFRVGDKVMQTRNNYDKEVFTVISASSIASMTMTTRSKWSSMGVSSFTITVKWTT